MQRKSRAINNCSYDAYQKTDSFVLMHYWQWNVTKTKEQQLVYGLRIKQLSFALRVSHVSFSPQKNLFSNISGCTSFHLIHLPTASQWDLSHIKGFLSPMQSQWPYSQRPIGEDRKEKKKNCFFFRSFFNYGNSWWDRAFEKREQMFSRTATRQISKSMTGGTSEVRVQTPTQTYSQTSMQDVWWYILWRMLCWASFHICSVLGQHCSYIWSLRKCFSKLKT